MVDSRTCSKPGCNRVLSVHNGTDRCALHPKENLLGSIDHRIETEQKIRESRKNAAKKVAQRRKYLSKHSLKK